jgi:type IV pilus assembly protein PilO
MIGTALAVVLVLVAGVMLLVQPRRSEAATLKEQTASQEAQNIALQQKINTLKAQQQDLPRQQARLAQIRQQLPAGPNLPSFVRALTDIERTTGVTVVALAPADPEPLTQPAAGGQTAQQPVTPDSAPVAAGVQQIPVKITVTGTYAELTAFLTRLETLQRSVLIGEVTVAEPTSNGSAAPGTLQMDLGARVFMAPAAPVAQAPAAGTTAQGQAPAAQPDPSTTSQ